MKRYLLIFRFAEKTERMDRAKRTDALNQYLKKISDNECQLAFTTQDGLSLGIFFKTKKAAAQIYKELSSPNHTTAILLNDDHLLVLELGEDFSGYGFSKGWTWLQHH